MGADWKADDSGRVRITIWDYDGNTTGKCGKIIKEIEVRVEPNSQLGIDISNE